MNDKEVGYILNVISASYPNFKVTSPEFTKGIWSKMLAEYNAVEIEQALKAYILTDTTGFAPSIGQLIQKATMLKPTDGLNEMQAWAIVRKGIRNGNYGAEEEFEKLPQDIQKCVGSPASLREWAKMDSEKVESVVQSNFMRSYRTMMKRQEEIAKLPTSMQNALIGTSNTAILTYNEVSE